MQQYVDNSSRNMVEKKEYTYENLQLRLCQSYMVWLAPYNHLTDGYDILSKIVHRIQIRLSLGMKSKQVAGGLDWEGRKKQVNVIQFKYKTAM